jgi:hypothetical protein
MTFGEAPRSLPLVHARKTSERGAPFTTAGWRKMVARLGVAAKLGHRNIQHTVRYTELSPTRFKNLWRD